MENAGVQVVDGGSPDPWLTSFREEQATVLESTAQRQPRKLFGWYLLIRNYAINGERMCSIRQIRAM